MANIKIIVEGEELEEDLSCVIKEAEQALPGLFKFPQYMTGDQLMKALENGMGYDVDPSEYGRVLASMVDRNILTTSNDGEGKITGYTWQAERRGSTNDWRTLQASNQL